jgi:hypothetical protein
VACPLFTQSVGAVFGLDLDDGTRVVVKAHTFGTRSREPASMKSLEAVYAAQHELERLGFPCARVLDPPRPWPGGAAATMTFVAAPRTEDPHSAATRRAIAEGLAWFVELARSLDVDVPRVTMPEGLFAPPHNALFDFAAPGGEWIDAIAREARDALGTIAERPIVMHTDFSASNIRVTSGRIVAAFDMDSVAHIDEMRCLASTAVHFSYLGDPPWRLPTREEAIAFVDDYVRARGRALDAVERARLDASVIWAIAYTARCELALGTPGTMCAALRDAPRTYFD